MFRASLLSLALLTPSIASADAVRFRSTGRPVEIAVTDGGVRHRCTTPCELPLGPGLYSARVDGLDRQLDVGADDTVVVRPTRYRLLGVGVAMVAAGSVGLALGGSWASPLGTRERLISAGGGLTLALLAIPFITRSSARVLDGAPRLEHRRPPTPERLVLALGASYPSGATAAATRLAASLGYQLADSRLSFALDARHAAFAESQTTALVAMGRARIARLPIISINASAGAGLEWRDAVGPLAELGGFLQIEVPTAVKPRVGAAIQVVHIGEWRRRALGRVALALEL